MSKFTDDLKKAEGEAKVLNARLDAAVDQGVTSLEKGVTSAKKSPFTGVGVLLGGLFVLLIVLWIFLK